MSNAIQLCAAAFRQANLDQDLSSFSSNQEFPYNLALDLINTVIRDMNRRGNYWFTETQTSLPYSVGVPSYSFSALDLDPKRIIRIRRTISNYWGELEETSWRHFQARYRQSAMQTAMPTAWSKFGNMLELNVIPDQDYALVVSHFKDMPLISTTMDTLLVPEDDEDVIQEGIYAYLLQRMGRPDFAQAYQIFKDKVQALLGDMKQDNGIPNQMPANF